MTKEEEKARELINMFLDAHNSVESIEPSEKDVAIATASAIKVAQREADSQPLYPVPDDYKTIQDRIDYATKFWLSVKEEIEKI